MKVFAYILFFLTLLVPLLARPVHATDEEPDHICFRALDRNMDHLVVFEEFVPAYGPDSRAAFDQADANKDGRLDHDEYHSMLGGGAE